MSKTLLEKIITAVICALCFHAVAQCKESVTILRARDFGAIPNDGKCDIKSINDAITAAASKTPAVIEFESGTYNLLEPNQPGDTLIAINKISDLTLLGKTDPNGDPATVLERNVKNLSDHLDAAKQFQISDSSNITIKNIVSDNKPPFTSAGKITAVDKEKDIVEIEVFPGLPHFDGMQCYSSNNWDMKTRQLMPVHALTIGAEPKLFKHQWRKVPGSNDRLYRIQGMGFANRVEAGQAISWHFYVSGRGRQFHIANSSNITLENVHIYNIKQLGLFVNLCKNLTFRKLIIKPIFPQFAVGSRDAVHMSCNSGTLLVEDCYIKGVRWDPFNIKGKFCSVTDVLDRRRIKCTVLTGGTNFSKLADSTVVFWTGERPRVVKVAKGGWDEGTLNLAKGKSRHLPLSLPKTCPTPSRPAQHSRLTYGTSIMPFSKIAHSKATAADRYSIRARTCG